MAQMGKIDLHLVVVRLGGFDLCPGYGTDDLHLFRLGLHLRYVLDVIFATFRDDQTQFE